MPDVEKETAPRIGPIPWRQTLFFRVTVLCGVLLLCLLASVMVITRHFFREAIQEMESQAMEIVESVVLELEEQPNIAIDALKRHSMDLHQGVNIDIADVESQNDEASYTLERKENGRLVRVARVPVSIDDRHLMLTTSVTVAPQTEILRAFKNKYILVLMAVFLVALFLLLYVIAKSMRPLTELSDHCAEISSGKLRYVNTRGAYGEVRALEETFNSMVASLQEKEIMEGKLRQAQRLSALGNLAAGVAHDVRNPLNAIKLLSSHALDSLEEAASPAAQPLETIREEVDRLEGIVSNFLSLARESTLAPKPEDLDTLLEECLHLIQQDAQERGVRLLSELHTGGLRLRLDAKHWKRAILNVLINALEATPEGGRVRLFSRRTEAACEIEIRDDGPGIPREKIDRIFEPYFTTKTGGTGLGLSITRGIIEEHGGAIEFSSTEGQGSQVLIKLPIEELHAS